MPILLRIGIARSFWRIKDNRSRKRVSVKLARNDLQSMKAMILPSSYGSLTRITLKLRDSSNGFLSIASTIKVEYRLLETKKGLHIQQRYEAIAIDICWNSIVDIAEIVSSTRYTNCYLSCSDISEKLYWWLVKKNKLDLCVLIWF